MSMTTVPMIKIKQSQFDSLLVKERKYDAVVKDRDDLKAALRELVESYEECKRMKFIDARAPAAKDKFNKALAAAKKLMDPKEDK